ncbi:MAG TPA: S9 family peptidase [Verrucomicrobiae bacterium]|jgi:dipeptidyl aminopeptidase/acylaminoacyl peptidase|nr:S9 family peptidase [Verrucomicrobiae bacterium]
MTKISRTLFIRKAILIILILTATSTVAQTTSLPGKFITDPAQLNSQQRLGIQAFTIDKLYMTRAVGDSAWSPDGKQVAFVTSISGRNNLWLVSSESGWPTQLTVSNQRQVSPAWSPNGTWIAYASDYDGNEQWDIFLVSPKNGQVINLTNTPGISEEGPVWSPDGNTLAYAVKPKNSPSYEINLIDIGSRKVTQLTSNTSKELGNFAPIWSKDGKHIVFTQAHATGKDANIFLAPVAGGKAANLTPHDGEHTFAASDISPDGKTVLITSNAHNGYENVGLLDIASKKITWLTSDKWEINAGKFSPDGKRVTWTSNIDGNQDIFVYDLLTHQARALPVAKGINDLAGAESPFTRDGSRVLFYHNGPNAPNDLWVYDFVTQKPRQITNSLVAGIRGDDMVEPVLVHYPSKDGKWEISAFVYVPYSAERNGQNAAIVYIHGGPTAQSQNSFSRNIQYLVNQGYFVITPNYRGSTGYGKEFMDANRFDMGGGDLEDVISAAEWIKKTGFVDPKKVAVMGGSYGGYLTMMAVTKAPDLWAAGVPIVPFVNWFTEVENEDPLLREYDLATMGDPNKDKARYQERSPINFVDQVKAPLLLLAGGNDPRCPHTEAEQVASAIKKRKGIVELKIYENEGHGFAKVENQIDAYTRVAEFLRKYVPPAKCGCNLD